MSVFPAPHVYPGFGCGNAAGIPKLSMITALAFFFFFKWYGICLSSSLRGAKWSGRMAQQVNVSKGMTWMDACGNQCTQNEPSTELTWLVTSVLAVTVSLLTFILWSQFGLWNELLCCPGNCSKRRQESVWVANTISTLDEKLVLAGADQPLAEEHCAH